MIPFWGPLALGFLFWQVWVPYKQTQWNRKQRYILLEIKVPLDVRKSPLAMELFLNALHQTVGESSWYERWAWGKTRAYFSLEIVSIEGRVRFFIWTRAYLRKFVETQLYSQYSTAEVVEVPDYTASAAYMKRGGEWALFAAEFILQKPDPLPIRTYVDYGLDKSITREEEKIDPITPMIEFLGDLGRGEQAWFQFIIRANKGEKDKVSQWTRDWQEEGRELIDKFVKETQDRSKRLADSETSFTFPITTEREKRLIESVSRNISKPGFDCGIRGIYIAKQNAFNPANIAGLFGSMKSYGFEDLNGFRPRDFTDVDHPWQEYINIPIQKPGSNIPFFSLKGERVVHKRWLYFDAYRRRSWFYPPYERKPFVLNAEELATIYHFPGRVAETPTFGRIESKKAEPPANLPI